MQTTPRMRSVLRLWLAVTVSALVWLVAAPAFAAPICDSRGASAFAPNPKLDEPVASLDLVASSDCMFAADFGVGVDQGHDSRIDLDFSVTPACIMHASGVARAHSERLSVGPAAQRDPPSADAARLDRPPR